MPESLSTSSRPRLLILGGTGMLGSALVSEIGRDPSLDLHVTARDPAMVPNLEGLDGRTHVLDVLDDNARRHTINAVAPDVVVNAIGVVKQTPEVSDPVLTVRLNALLPHLLAQETALAGARLVHVSTDCVFSGQVGGYSEDDSPDPVDFYGRSKLLGEVGRPHLTIRTSIIGHELTRHTSLLDWFLSQEGTTVNGFTNAIFSGVTTIEVARFLRNVVLPRPRLQGLLHLASEPISKYHLLQLIAQEYDWKGTVVPSPEFQCDRSLVSKRMRAETGYVAPRWETMLADMRAEREEEAR